MPGRCDGAHAWPSRWNGYSARQSRTLKEVIELIGDLAGEQLAASTICRRQGLER